MMSFAPRSSTHSDISFAILEGKMHTKRYQLKCLDYLFLQDLDFSGALIQGVVFASNHQATAYFVQALENYSTAKHTRTRRSKTCNDLDDLSLLRYVSSFIVQKERQWSSQRLFRTALLISRNLHKKYYSTLTGLRALQTTISCPSCANPDSEIIACTASQQTPSETHLTPTTTADYRPTARRGSARTPFSQHSTFCGPFMASTPKPSLLSPIRSCTLNSAQDPPSTPIQQILSTPLDPPRIENKEPRTLSGLVLFDRELDFTGVSLVNARLPVETPYHTYQPNRRLSFRNRLWVRRLSYPHFKTSTASHLSSSPLKMPDITTASSANRPLASPLNVRSSTSSCAPQTTEDDSPSHLQWSPHCPRCFA